MFYGWSLPVILSLGVVAFAVLMIGVCAWKCDETPGMELDRFVSYDPDADEGYPFGFKDWDREGWFQDPQPRESLVFASGGRRAQARALSVVDQAVQSELYPNVTPLREVTGPASDAS